MHRSILADKPRVTKFQVEWDKPEVPPTAGEPEDLSMQAEFTAHHEYSPVPPPSFGSTGQEYLPNGIAIDMES